MRLCNNGTDVVPELMMFKLSFCFSVSTSLSPSVTPSWWFQVWVYWCFMASDLLSHTLNADAHTQCRHRRTRSHSMQYTDMWIWRGCAQPPTRKNAKVLASLSFRKTHTGCWWRMHCKKNRFRKSTAERTTASPWNQAQTRRIRQEEYQQKKELLDTPLRCKILTVTSNPTHHTLKLSISRSFFPQITFSLLQVTY